MSLSRGAAILLGACAGAVTLPGAAFLLGLPLWMDGGLAGAVMAGVYFVSRSGAPETLDDQTLIDARNQTGRSLIPDAQTSIDRMKKAQTRIQDASVRGQINDLVQAGSKVLAAVRADPSKAMAVRRLLTFYLPNAASIAEGWVALEGRATPSPERMAQTGATLRSLNEAFAKFSDDMVEPQMQTLDIDLKVVNDALKSDLEKTA